jgi:hypothetical protein
MRRAALIALLCAACGRSESSARKAPPQDQGSRSKTVYVVPGSASIPSPFGSAAPPASAPPPPPPSAPPAEYASAEGRFRVTPPARLVAHPTAAGTLWDGDGRSFAVLYYDGKPRGVDRSPLYASARDKLGDSAIDQEQETTIDGHKAMRRVLHASAKSGAFIYRKNLIVPVGDRTYDVSVTAADRTRVEDGDAERFFESFHAAE